MKEYGKLCQRLAKLNVRILFDSRFGQGCQLFWKVGGAKNSAESLKILAESASYDFSAEISRLIGNPGFGIGKYSNKKI
jgi:hypothetical protein